MMTDPLPTQQPPVVLWFKVYSGLMALLYLLVFGFFSVGFGFDPNMAKEMPVGVIVTILVIFGLVFVGAFLLPLFVQPKPWVWIYDLVLICIGLGGCTLVAAVPLLIFWLKPETKVYFGRSPY